MKTIRIATRNSPLALWQANFVKDQLLQAHNAVDQDAGKVVDVEIVGMTTKGDQLLDRSLAAIGGKGLFLKELEVSLSSGETDIAVHSMKDVPVDLPQGLEIAVCCERADPRDAFVSNDFQNLYALPKGAKVGTSSLRRVAQLKAAFPALEFNELRGNVNTRLQKLDEGEYDAIILAASGLMRLGLEGRIKQYITPELCLPAVGQGIIGVECRSEDRDTKALLAPLHSRQSELILAAERSFNAALEGGCQVPVGAYAEVLTGKIRLRGVVGEPDGTNVLLSEKIGTDISIVGAEVLGEDVADELLKQGAADILSSINREPAQPLRPDKPVVLLTRQFGFLGNTAWILKRLDYQSAHIPTLKIERCNKPDVLAKFKKLDRYTDLIFVSRNSVEIGMKAINKVGGIPADMRVMAVGSETAKQLFRHGIDSMFPEADSGAEALLQVEQLQDLTDRRILVVRGDSGLDWPADEMRKRGAQVDHAECYRLGMPRNSRTKLEDVFAQNVNVSGVFIHSVQSLKNLVKIAGPHINRLMELTLVAGSENIAKAAQEVDWKGEIRVASSPTNKHMMIAFSATPHVGH